MGVVWGLLSAIQRPQLGTHDQIGARLVPVFLNGQPLEVVRPVEPTSAKWRAVVYMVPRTRATGCPGTRARVRAFEGCNGLVIAFDGCVTWLGRQQKGKNDRFSYCA